jgi:chromate reductase
MTTILGISGSLRKASLNTSLLRAAVGLMPEGATLDAKGIDGIPLYDGDAEAADGLPPAVTALKARLLVADGLLLVTPEYNNSIPGPFKNAIDWMTRPASEIGRHFGGKPVAVIGASPGGFGTILSQNAWLPVLRTLGTKPYFGGRLMVSRANTLVDADGALTDQAARDRLAAFLAGFVEFARSA